MAQSASTLVTVRIIESTSHTALSGATVTLDDVTMEQTSDSAGIIRFPSVAVGSHRVEARRIGYDPAHATLVVRTDKDTASVVLTMHATVQRLDSVRVLAAARPQPLAEFEERRARGFGQFITPAQLDSMTGSSLEAIFARRIRGFRIVNDRTNGIHVTSVRQITEHALVGAPRATCPPLIYLDGVTLSGDGDRGPDISAIRLSDLGAVEVYAPSEIPARFRAYGVKSGIVGSTPSCGAVLLWTRP